MKLSSGSVDHFRGPRLRGLCRLLRVEEGQTVVLAAFCFPVLLGFLGFAADIGLLTIEKEKVQSAADSAAIAGAAELNYGDYASAAQGAAALNGFTNGANGATVSVNPSGDSTPTPLYGEYANQAGYLEVVVSQSQPTVFMRVLGFTNITVSARSVAAQGRNPNCVFLLQSSTTTLTINNGAQLNAPSCGLVDDSSSSTAVSVSGGATLATSSTEVAGSYSASNSTVTPTPTTGIVPVSDPMAYLSPPAYTASSCTGDPYTNYQGGSTYSVGPGATHTTTQAGNLVCYTSLNLGANGDTVTLNPGVYVITGSLHFYSGTVNGGDGVTFYITGAGSVTFDNGASFSLSAPTSGAYDGVLFYQDRADTQAVSIQGGASATMQGILYFPDAPLTLGNGSSMTFYSPIIAASMTLVGGTHFTDDDYSTVNPSSPLTTPRLVE